MALKEEIERHGAWLFRWRSYAPLPVLILMAVAAAQFSYPANSHALQERWEIACLAVSLLGLGLRAFTVGYAAPNTSGRNTRAQKADSLNTTGIYSSVRHPLYLGNFLIGLGLTMFYLQWWLTLCYSLLFWLYYERIMLAEEEFLRRKFGDEFLDWAKRTPAFIPRFRNWRPSPQSFSWQAVCRAEYNALGLIILCFAVMDVAEEVVANGEWTMDPHWWIICPLGFAAFLGFFTWNNLTKSRAPVSAVASH